jgi:hypothetical protein
MRRLISKNSRGIKQGLSPRNRAPLLSTRMTIIMAAKRGHTPSLNQELKEADIKNVISILKRRSITMMKLLRFQINN